MSTKLVPVRSLPQFSQEYINWMLDQAQEYQEQEFKHTGVVLDTVGWLNRLGYKRKEIDKTKTPLVPREP